MVDAVFMLEGVARYYGDKVAEHGGTPRGVDWNGAESQTLRFEQLAKVFRAEDKAFSVGDLGCGYGAFVDFLDDRQAAASYVGYDISEAMLVAARARFGARDDVRFLRTSTPDIETDYCIASGIFNVRLETSDDVWCRYIEKTLDRMNGCSRKGFAFNCLTSYADADKKKDYLYYADPCYFFDRCRRLYSTQVALLHDYGLYDFTILVRKAKGLSGV